MRSLLAMVLFVCGASVVLASGASVGAPGALPATTPTLVRVVDSAYDYAFLLGGLLAFGAVVYGGFRYTFSAGNSSAESDAKDQITQAALGLLLLLGSYVVLNTVSPTLTSFKLPTLKDIERVVEAEPLGVPVSSQCQVPFSGATRPQCFEDTTCGGGSQCSGPCATFTGPACTNLSSEIGSTRCPTCTEGAAVGILLLRLPEPYRSVQATTHQGTHRQNSCHFGGTSCQGESRAIDWGINAARAEGVSLSQIHQAVMTTAQEEGIHVSCFCENEGGSLRGQDCSNSAYNHVHCNVDAGSCGCE